MTESTIQGPAPSEPGTTHRRRAVPPWQVVLGFVLLVCSRFINSQLWFSMHADARIAALNTSFLLITATFWFWPRAASDDPKRSASPWLRWWSLTALLCFAAHELGIAGDRPQNTRGPALLAVLVFGIYSAALIYPFPRLFAELRLNRALPASSALGPCALFFFYALMVPALVQGMAADSPSHLRWIMLIVPPFTTLFVWLDLRERSAASGWKRGLATLLWKTALLPLLLLLGEASVVAIGVSSGY